MTDRRLVQLSKFLSLILRHNPAVVGVELDEQGWTDVDALILKINQTENHRIDRETLDYIVAKNNKSRFGYNADKSRIRANQGHSLDIELGYEPVVPPAVLYHRANTDTIGKFERKGISSKNKKHTYLGDTPGNAVRFGHWRGNPVLVKIDAAAMHRDGHQFYHSNSGIWLTEVVPPQYFERLV